MVEERAWRCRVRTCWWWASVNLCRCEPFKRLKYAAPRGIWSVWRWWAGADSEVSRRI